MGIFTQKTKRIDIQLNEANQMKINYIHAELKNTIVSKMLSKDPLSPLSPITPCVLYRSKAERNVAWDTLLGF